MCSSDLHGAGIESNTALINEIKLRNVAVWYIIPPSASKNQIGRASCRERVLISVVAVSLKKKKKHKQHLETHASTVTSINYTLTYKSARCTVPAKRHPLIPTTLV